MSLKLINRNIFFVVFIYIYYNLLAIFILLYRKGYKLELIRKQNVDVTKSFVVIWVVYFLNVLSRIIFSPMMPEICKEYSASGLDAGNIFLILSIGVGISLFFSQFVSSKISHKNTIVLSTFITGTFLVFLSFCKFWILFKVLFFFLGIGAGLFLPSGVSILTSIFENKNWGKTFSLFSVAQGAAFVLSPLIFDVFFIYFSWRVALLLLGMVMLFFCFYIKAKLPYGNSKGDASVSFLSQLFTKPSFWIIIILSCLITGLNIGIYNMIPHYFSNTSLASQKNIHTYMILARTIGIFATLVSGIIMDRFGLKKAISTGLVLCGMFTICISFFSMHFAFFAFCLESIVAVCIYPMVHVAILRFAPKEKSASMVSISSSVGFIYGSGIQPQLLGIFEHFNMYSFGFVFIGIIAIFFGSLFFTSSLKSLDENVVIEN
jgi:MFS transporter, NNP family, nitrate/nitrite transporter